MDDFKEYVDINDMEEADNAPDVDTKQNTDLPQMPAYQTQKKGGLVQRTILISAVIVGVVLAAAIICRLFAENGVVKTDILGNKATTCWHYTAEYPTSTPDETFNVDYYLFFEPNGKLRVKMDTIEYIGAYSFRRVDPKDDSKNAGKPYLEISQTGITLISNFPFDGKYFYSETGGVFNRKLKLSYYYDKSISYEFDQKSYSPVKTKREGEFKGDDSLYGTWKQINEQSEQTFVFKSNGDFEFKNKSTDYFTNQISIVKQSGIFNCENGQLSLYSGTINTQPTVYKYSVDGDTLSFFYQTINRNTLAIEEQKIEYKKQ